MPKFGAQGEFRAERHGGDVMDKKKLDGFKKRLEERQRELRQTVSRTAQDGREADSGGGPGCR